MSESFFQRVAQKFGVKSAPRVQPPFIDATVFGKHPAWNDHIPELGPDHDRLVEIKGFLYEGITGNIDNGEWDKLEKSGQLQPYGHSFLWTGRGDPVAGRCWYSRDGKGRDRYPMMAAVLCGNLPLSWTTREAFPVLQLMQQECSAAKSVQEVRAALDSGEQTLKRLATAVTEDHPPESPGSAQAVAYLASCPELGPQRTGLLRILYHLEREMPDSKSSASRTTVARAITLRFPACAASPAEAAGLWTRFLRSKIAAEAPLIVLVPDTAAWVDAIVGPVGASQLFCMRAPLELVPFTSEIPYSLDHEFLKRAEKGIEDSLAGAEATSPG